MFVYSLNCPVMFTDSNGYYPFDIYESSFSGSGVVPERQDNSSKAEEESFYCYEINVERLVLHSTIITQRAVVYNGKTYITFDAAIQSNLFFEFGDAKTTWKDTVALYTEYLYEHINSLKIAEYDYYTMSKEHIYSEIMAHLLIWRGIAYPSTEIKNLNVDENRYHVKLLMQLYGYSGKEDVS